MQIKGRYGSGTEVIGEMVFCLKV
ncbi:MAG: hypothetical protein H6Q06_1549, partial [Acidobacteria bacterium]|nr:hypothetical protein [Acidobacteriota bacterium]